MWTESCKTLCSLLAAKSLSDAAYNDFLDHTFLADRKTTIREYLATTGSGIMEEEPPESLKARYGGWYEQVHRAEPNLVAANKASHIRTWNSSTLRFVQAKNKGESQWRQLKYVKALFTPFFSFNLFSHHIGDLNCESSIKFNGSLLEHVTSITLKFYDYFRTDFSLLG